VLLQEMNWPSIASVSKDVPLVVPIAAVEQHGGHLPVFTDSILLGEVVRRAAEKLGDRIVWAPLLWLGNSHHHLDFAGTLSASPRTYLDLLVGLIDNLVTHGFRRIVLLNGHGGNIVPGSQAVFEARQRYRSRDDLLLLAATYWLLGSRPGSVDHSILQNQMGHACEWETSMLLRLTPHLVGPLECVEPIPFGNPFDPASRGWITRERSAPGHIGDPRQATADKGETLLRLFSGDVAAFLDRVIAWDGRSWDG
jgi:creatinine amidohydrolase